jgi:hypothetical protein
MKATHYNHSGSGVPACLNGTRDSDSFRLTAVRKDVTCKKCLAEIKKMEERENA